MPPTGWHLLRGHLPVGFAILLIGWALLAVVLWVVGLWLVFRMSIFLVIAAICGIIYFSLLLFGAEP